MNRRDTFCIGKQKKSSETRTCRRGQTRTDRVEAVPRAQNEMQGKRIWGWVGGWVAKDRQEEEKRREGKMEAENLWSRRHMTQNILATTIAHCSMCIYMRNKRCTTDRRGYNVQILSYTRPLCFVCGWTRWWIFLISSIGRVSTFSFRTRSVAMYVCVCGNVCEAAAVQNAIRYIWCTYKLDIQPIYYWLAVLGVTNTIEAVVYICVWWGKVCFSFSLSRRFVNDFLIRLCL